MDESHPAAVLVGMVALVAIAILGVAALGFLVGLFFATAERTFDVLGMALVLGMVA